ncbi:WD40-repeat-containing domain protein [Halteromyces radiatus]|uniref:WD40-repeat-containing domain protein n=1 Tax=Halteromyces radiatus TaxID=101107 RepID=UPI00221F2796|nr:WD40-repeat-containing domain protein [Halteromyces radiatus]KAI8099356.1 WD40-repeat-containing domain protein [Halteromyces radiatus]
MSVYNHRPMVPTPVNRFVEMLDSIRNEFDQLTQEAYICKSQRDDFELKMNSQIQEMSSFQQNLLELERTQQGLKKHYEEEIARLRQQLEQAQSRANHPMATPKTPMSSSPSNVGHPSSHQPPPPNIGPGSNYFGGIMNAHGNQGPPGLVAPPQMGEPSPSHHPGYSPAPPPPGYMNGSPASNQGHPSSAPVQYGSSYPPQKGAGTPVNQSAPLLPSDMKRKSGPPPPPSAYPPQNIQQPQAITPGGGGGRSNLPMKSPGTNSSGALADMDPEVVPANMKIEGQDWFALFNPKANRYLTVDLVHTLDHSSVVCCVKFSQDGRYMATGCNRSTFIYDVATAQRICVLQDENTSSEGDLYIRSVCFSPDGKYLATGAEDKQIRIWDIAQRRIRFKLTGHEQDIYSLDFSRDGRIVVSGSGDCTARIWDMADGSLLHTLVIKDKEQRDPGVTSVAISPDSRLVAAGSLDKMVRVWDAYDGKLLDQLEGHKDSVYSVAFMPDGNTLVSGSLDKTLKLWQLGGDRDRARNHCKMTFVGHKDFVLSVACTPDGNWVVSGSKDRGVQFWDPRTGQTQFMLQGHKNSVISVAISPSGRPLFATGSGDNRARIWSYDPIS